MYVFSSEGAKVWFLGTSTHRCLPKQEKIVKQTEKEKNFKSVKPAECVGLEVRRKYMEKTYLHQNLFMGHIMWETKKCPLT